MQRQSCERESSTLLKIYEKLYDAKKELDFETWHGYCSDYYSKGIIPFAVTSLHGCDAVQYFAVLYFKLKHYNIEPSSRTCKELFKRLGQKEDYCSILYTLATSGALDEPYDDSPQFGDMFLAQLSEILNDTNKLLNELEEAIKKKLHKSNPMFKKATLVVQEGKNLSRKNLNNGDRRLLNLSISSATDVILFPENQEAITILGKNAKMTLGRSSFGKRFGGFLLGIVGAAIIGLAVMGIPFTCGTSALIGAYVGGAIFTGLGLFSIYNGKQKSMSKAIDLLTQTVSCKRTM